MQLGPWWNKMETIWPYRYDKDKDNRNEEVQTALVCKMPPRGSKSKVDIFIEKNIPSPLHTYMGINPIKHDVFSE